MSIILGALFWSSRRAKLWSPRGRPPGRTPAWCFIVALPFVPPGRWCGAWCWASQVSQVVLFGLRVWQLCCHLTEFSSTGRYSTIPLFKTSNLLGMFSICKGESHHHCQHVTSIYFFVCLWIDCCDGHQRTNLVWPLMPLLELSPKRFSLLSSLCKIP